MTRTLAAFTMFVLALTLSVSAFAAGKSQTVTLYHDTQINGKTLPPGEYTVKYDTTGSNAQVKFLRDGKEVASATGTLKQLTSAPEHSQIVTQDGNGSVTLSEIDFAHSTTGVSFESSAMSSAGSN
ncbi:MAG TPA: hypothetical protein VFB04_10675 [Terriglobales bacterium]|nr:hypothetical protein [Terriglobales bacterium]